MSGHVHDGWGPDLTNDCRGCEAEYVAKEQARWDRDYAAAVELRRLARIGAWVEATTLVGVLVHAPAPSIPVYRYADELRAAAIAAGSEPS